MSIKSTSGCSYITTWFWPRPWQIRRRPQLWCQAGKPAFLPHRLWQMQGMVWRHIKEGLVHNSHFIQLIRNRLGVAVIVQEVIRYNKCFLFTHYIFKLIQCNRQTTSFYINLSGVLNQSMFSLLSATVLMFNKCLTPTLSNWISSPEPQPRVRDGATWSCKGHRYLLDDGVLTNIRQVFILSENSEVSLSVLPYLYKVTKYGQIHRQLPTFLLYQGHRQNPLPVHCQYRHNFRGQILRKYPRW